MVGTRWVSTKDRLLDLIVGLRAYLRDEAEPPVRLSDRRMGKAVRLIRLAAFAAWDPGAFIGIYRSDMC
ncbi:hypothetical protein AK812_SmicGene23377 [Symbiodinium microadriaticum]|uniref:ATPase RavA-like AAA lid domain-containing protein n=1 Tax=Symbiodinium microadriaticum TaxID=2951 RepID=A0A1Q9DHG8_SYMMI|nr:hypothetical protein AK812_SmicGene23377 [Symbiodinium microadriaticum]